MRGGELEREVRAARVPLGGWESGSHFEQGRILAACLPLLCAHAPPLSAHPSIHPPGCLWQGMIEAQAGGGAPWSAYAQRLLAPDSQLFRWPRPGGHDDKVGLSSCVFQ